MRWFEAHLPARRPRSGRSRRSCGLLDRRTAVARSAAEADATRMFRPRPCRSWPSAQWTSGRSRRWSAASRSPATSATRSGCAPEYQRALYDAAARRGRGVRHRPFRRARAELAAAGEELRHLGARVPADLRTLRSGARPLRRPGEERLHRPRRRARRETRERRQAAARQSSPSTRRTPMRSATSRSGTMARWSAGSRRAATRTGRQASVALGYVPERGRRRRSRLRDRDHRRSRRATPDRKAAVRSRTGGGCALDRRGRRGARMVANEKPR